MANDVLIIFVFLILIAVVAVVASLIYFGLKRSRETQEKITVMVSTQAGSPLEGADVKLGERIASTDSYGKAEFELPRGEHELLVMAEGCEEFRQKIRAGSRKLVYAKLLPEKKNPELRRLEKALSEARRARDEIGLGYNPTIPEFMFRICLEVHRAALEEARSQQDKKLRAQAIRSAELAISQTAKGMVERRNLSLYAKAKGKKEKEVMLPGFRTPDLSDAKKKLSVVDFLITQLAGKNAIYSPLVLWKTSQKLLAEPTIFNLKLSAFLLDSAEKMIAELGDYFI